MQVKLLSITPQAEELIETCGRICYQSEPKEGYKVGTMIKSLIKSGHHSVLEHASATFLISDVSRALSHQIVRHRICSFSQKSQRYVKEDMFEFVTPDVLLVDGLDPTLANSFKNDMQVIQGMYDKWKKLGLKNEDARFVLPNACTTELAMTANFREWRKIIELRSDSHAQWEIRKCSDEILALLNGRAPNVFGDLANKFLSATME